MLSVQATSQEHVSVEGIILTRQVREYGGSIFIEYWLLTDDGPVRVVTPPQHNLFFVLQTQLPDIIKRLNSTNLKYQHRALELKTFDHQPAAALYFSSVASMYRARDILIDGQLECFEHDIRLADRYLMERFIYGSMQCVSTKTSRENGYVTLRNVQCKPITYTPCFNTLSFDIECSEKGELYSIGLVTEQYRRVFMIGKPEPDAPDWIQWVDHEQDLLIAFIDAVELVDPDIIIGWNVVNFDIRLLIKRAAMHSLPLTLGRDGSVVHWRDARGERDQGFVSIAGRVVIDGIDALKSATYHFDSFSLEFVAQALLGKGKQTEDVDNRMAAINHDFRHNKVKLAKYNVQDCVLVMDIFKHTQLIEYLTLRGELTGLELSRVGGSVAAFINVYLPKLHRAGYISPNRPEGGGLASPGGYVMDSKPGLYRHVLVLDFKSLYPSIIRTFLIDPLGLVEGLAAPEQAVPGFKGALFSREHHFLPNIIQYLWQARDKAKLAHDEARSQAIKILMNSFYGVLGSGGCPFYDTRLASSITMRGQEIMQVTAEWIENEGYEVIYGDTDSTFVRLVGDYDYAHAAKVGRALQDTINEKWQERIKRDFGLECALDIEFETYFSQFLMPTIRGSHLGSKKRYAGIKETDKNRELVFKGLETVRSDWTPLAKTFQQKLYALVFDGEDVKPYILSMISATLEGKYDADLVYRKRLRRPLSHYVKNVPPHVRAARLADEGNRAQGKALRYQNKGWVSYLLTLSGPQAIERQTSAIDYEHYIDKQIRPVAEAILPFIGLSFDDIANSQLDLF